MENSPNHELNSAIENDAFHNQLPPPDFGFPENVSYDLIPMPLEQHQNNFDAFSLVDNVSGMDYGSSSLNQEIMPTINSTSFQSQYPLPDSFTYTPVNDFFGVDYGSSSLNQEIMPTVNSNSFLNQYPLPDSFTFAPVEDLTNIFGVDYGSSSFNQEFMPTVNSSGFQSQTNQPLMIGGPISNTVAMNNNKGKEVETVDQSQTENLELRNSRLTLEKEISAEKDVSGGDNYTHIKKPMLSRETISNYFYLPIKQAAKELKVGTTLLKQRCRDLGIGRWPHRKLKSLQNLINNVHELGNKAEGNVGETIQMLEREKKKLEEIPDLQIDLNTKRLRQAYFKESHKKQRKMGVVASSSGQQQSLPSGSNAGSINPHDNSNEENKMG